jgi:hypothetical protein
MADTDSSYIDLAELNRLSSGLFDLSCELDSVAHVASLDESSPLYHLGFLLGRLSERLATQVSDLQGLSLGARS